MVRVFFGGYWHDLTQYVDLRSVSVKRTADKTFDTASFNIPKIGHAFISLDTARALPRNARVEIFGEDFIIQTDNVVELSFDVYSHSVECVSLSRILADTTNAGLTVTQPQGDIGLYYRSFSAKLTPSAFLFVNTYMEMGLSLLENSADTSELDGVTLKKNKEYTINVSIDLKNTTAKDFFGKLSIRVGGVEIAEKSIGIRKAALIVTWWTHPRTNRLSFSIKHNNVGTNDVQVFVKQDGGLVDLGFTIENVKMAISTSDSYTLERIKLDYVVEKLLNNDANLPKFTLNESTKAYLGKFESYDWSLPASYLWLQLTQIADYIKAFPFATFGDDNKVEISIIPFEETSVPFEPVGISDLASQATIDDYSSALEIAADTMSSNNVISEITSLRADGETTQIDTDSLIIPTKERIGSIVDFRIKVPKNITVNSITITKGTWISIDTDRILREEYYNTLGSKSEYNGAGRFSFSKNNCLFYKEGEKGIKGLSFFGEQLKTQFLPNQYIRAIYEVLIAQLVRNNATSGYSTPHFNYDDGTTTLDNEIIIRINYKPYTSSNAVIYKSDQSGFVFKTIKYSGEEMTINSPDILGSYVQGVADRSGGTIHNFSGICRKEELPPILSNWNGMTLFAIAWQFISDDLVSYTLQYIKDYVYISSYESYNPKEKSAYLVPQTNVQKRVIKKNIHLVLGTTEQSSDNIGVPSDKMRRFFNHLIGEDEMPPFLARVRGELADESVVTSAVPIISQAIGRTLEFRVEMKDNYSAGLTKYVESGNTYQKDWRYTDVFGRVDFTQIEFYAYTINNDYHFNALPNPSDLVFNSANLIATMYFEERKDAREHSIYSLQFSYMSGNDDIIIYDSIGRFSNFTPRGTRDIKCVSLMKTPKKSQKMIDASYIYANITASVVDLGEGIGYLQTTSGELPLAFYDKNTGELLLVDLRKTVNRKIYYRGVLV